MEHKKTKKIKHAEHIDTVNKETYSDDVVFEEEDGMAGKMKKLKEKLDICATERQEYLDGWQRAKAELINFRKDQENRSKYLSDRVQSDLITEMLPTLDSFEMAFCNKEVWESIDKNWRIGVEYIHSQLLDILKRNGLVEVNPIKEMFDPKYHDSFELVDVAEKESDGKVVEVAQKGYLYKDKIIRAARVKVGRHRPK
ncbi:nucleotide exchange factor GrpE [Candidatus Nomurabacteria bacterium CG1_02_47_685]|nr:MAG: nucleotide exchange factor GrpE [Candidatus Nomurabacteria bacterium CG1_02_47_685]